MPTAIVMIAPIAPTPTRATPRPSRMTQEVARADVDVLEHPVALAVVEDRPGEPGDAREDDRPEGRPDDDEAAVCRVVAAADDLEHDDEDQRGRDRLRHRVDEEQERVGPVRLHLPAEADRGPEAAPRLAGAAASSVRDGSKPPHSGDPRPARRAGAVVAGGHCHRIERRPSRRAIRSSAASIQRAASSEDDGHRDEDQRLDLRRRRAERGAASRRRRAGASRRGRPPAGSSRAPAPRGGRGCRPGS